MIISNSTFHDIMDSKKEERLSKIFMIKFQKTKLGHEGSWIKEYKEIQNWSESKKKSKKKIMKYYK